MGQLHWSRTRVLILDSCRLAENNVICPGGISLRSILTEISRLENSLYDVIRRGSDTLGFFQLAYICQKDIRLHMQVTPRETRMNKQHFVQKSYSYVLVKN